MSEVIQSALIGAGGTLLAAAIGIVAIVFQLGRQGSLNRDSIAEAERRRLRSQMYEEVDSACGKLFEAQASFASKLVLATQEVQIAAYSHEEQDDYPLPRSRIMDINLSKSEFDEAFSNVISLIERRQFISPDILIFRTALQAAFHGVREKYHRQFFRAAMMSLPVDRPDGSGVHPYRPLKPELADSLNDLAIKITEDLTSVATYAGDFSVEMQNHLVADLFGTKVGHRVPLDPQYRVVRLDNAKELEKHFMEETEWGKWVQEQEAKAHEKANSTSLTS